MYAIMLNEDDWRFFRLGTSPEDSVRKIGHGNRTSSIREATLYSNLGDIQAQRGWIRKNASSYWAGQIVKVNPDWTFAVWGTNPARLV